MGGFSSGFLVGLDHDVHRPALLEGPSGADRLALKWLTHRAVGRRPWFLAKWISPKGLMCSRNVAADFVWSMKSKRS